MCLDAGVAGCRRGRKMIEVGSEPLDRLLVKMAKARSVSGRRGGRLPPWPEVRRGGREPDERPSATVAGGPSFVPASVVGGHGIVERARNGQRAFGPSVDRLWTIGWRGWRRPEVCLDAGVTGCRRGRSGPRAGGCSVGCELARLLEARDLPGLRWSCHWRR